MTEQHLLSIIWPLYQLLLSLSLLPCCKHMHAMQVGSELLNNKAVLGAFKKTKFHLAKSWTKGAHDA